MSEKFGKYGESEEFKRSKVSKKRNFDKIEISIEDSNGHWKKVGEAVSGSIIEEYDAEKKRILDYYGKMKMDPPKVMKILVVCGSGKEFNEFKKKNVRKGIEWIYCSNEKDVYGYRMDADPNYRNYDLDGFVVFTGQYWGNEAYGCNRLNDMLAMGRIKRYNGNVVHV